MFALVKNNEISLFPPYTVFEDKDGIQYSPDQLLSWTAEEKQAKGIYDVAYQPRPDERFFSVVENAPVFDAEEKIVKISYTSTAKELEDVGESPNVVIGLKSNWIIQFKDFSNKELSKTDWMLVRKIERDVDVPSATTAYRQAVVAESNRLETAINAATTVDDVIAAVESANWPTAE